jgi:hypothetical protein
VKTTINHTVQFGYSSGYAIGFLKALPNVDIALPVTIIPNAKKEGDKLKTTIFFEAIKRNVEVVLH